MTPIRLLFALFVTVGASSALAQTPAPAAPAPAAAAPAAAALPVSPCVKPGHYPGKKASDVRKEAWMNEMKSYGTCTTAFVADVRAQIDARVKARQQHGRGLQRQLEGVAGRTAGRRARSGPEVIG